MIGRTTALLVVWSLLASSACALAQEVEDFPDSALTAEQWQQRVQDACRRAETFVANARNLTADPPSSDKEDAEVADQRAMNDPSLQPGDIIATSRGFRVFVGRDEGARKPDDFLPAPNPQNSLPNDFGGGDRYRDAVSARNPSKRPAERGTGARLSIVKNLDAARQTAHKDQIMSEFYSSYVFDGG